MEGVQEGLADVFVLPLKGLSCEDCSSVLFGRYGAYCREFQEDIPNLLIAGDCGAYDPVD